MPKIFISHSSQDRDFVLNKVIALLEGHGVTTWHMGENIPTATHWEREILVGLQSCEWVLVAMSPRSAESEWVRDEVQWAINNRPGKIVPLLVEECDPYKFHVRVARLQHVDFSTGPTDDAKSKLLKVLGVEFKPGAILERPGKSKSQSPQSDMQLLVTKFEGCRLEKGRLIPCGYHRDRLEVRLFEQSGFEGETDLSETQVRLSPQPSMLKLFRNMQMKTEVAGHWGLMRGHRDWLSAKFRQAFQTHFAGTRAPIRILQAGIAGYVHYFGNILIMNEQLDEVAKTLKTPPRVRIATYDVCLGSTRSIEVLLERLRETKLKAADDGVNWDISQEIDEIDVNGFRARVDPSFCDLQKKMDLLDDRWIHCLGILDLTEVHALADQPEPTDIVMSHYLFDMWTTHEEAKVDRFCANVSQASKPGTNVFLTMGTNRPGLRLTLDDYHGIFGRHGFSLVDVKLVWDIYDLDYQTRDKFVNERTPIDVKKESALVHYVKT